MFNDRGVGFQRRRAEKLHGAEAVEGLNSRPYRRAGQHVSGEMLAVGDPRDGGVYGVEQGDTLQYQHRHVGP